MSIWSFDLGIDPSWPEWFKEHRRDADAEMTLKIAAVMSGDLSHDAYREWALESSKRHVAWLDALPPDHRAWIEAEEKADEHVLVPPGTPMPPFNPNLLGRK